MRTAFIKTLMDLARADERIFLVVGDLGYSVVEPFAREFPDRFINVGVAEQNMIGIATGVTLCGKIAFTYSITNFSTFRCLEQIRNDVCFHNADVKIIATGGGLVYGFLEMTHHGIQNLAIMRALPNMTIIAPGDPVESALATRAMLDWQGPCYMQLTKAGDPVIHQTTPHFQIGKAITARDGNDITLIAIGGILYYTVQAAERLAQEGIKARVLSMHTLKPLDIPAVLTAARETGAIMTIEEHSVVGALGSAVAEVLAESEASHTLFKRLGIDDSFCSQVGNQEYLQKLYSLTVEDIVEQAVALYHSKVSQG